MFQIAGTSISFFLATILFLKKNKSTADKILFAWLLVFGCHLSFFILRYTRNSVEYSFLQGFEVIFPLLHGPFIYLYIAAVTHQLPKQRKWISFHFALPIACLALFSNFFLLSAGEQAKVLSQNGAGFQTQIIISRIIIYISGFAYIIWCLLLLNKHKHIIEKHFSQTESIPLHWLRYIVYGIGLIWIAVIAGNDDLIFLLAVFFVIILGIFGFKQQGIFTAIPPLEPAYQARTAAAPRKYEKSTLNDEQSRHIHTRLKKLMTEERLFENPDLTLDTLSTTLQVNPNHLSQVINSLENKNFYDYVNQLRVHYFMQLISRPENKNYKLLSLAYECGFNSKTAFNRNFKKITGLSPTDYLRKNASVATD